GTLYNSNAGIDYLILNLLANPTVTAIVAIAATAEDKVSQSIEALKFLWEYGYSEPIEGRRYITGGLGSISEVFPEECLNSLRKKLKLYVVDSISQAKNILKKANNLSPWGTSPVYLELPTVEVNTLPSDRIGQKVKGQTIADTWLDAVQRIVNFGVSNKSEHEDDRIELTNFTAVIKNEPEDWYFPEFLPFKREMVVNYIPRMTDNTVDHTGYSYGSRMRSHFGGDLILGAINKLGKNINSTQCVINLWDSVEDLIDSSPPCLNHIWLRALPIECLSDSQQFELQLTATFRSHDYFKAWIPNVFALRELQIYICHQLNFQQDYQIKAGALIINSLSAHIYEDDLDRAVSLIDRHWKYQPKFDDEV
ncbi:MAG: thymidylate synthase, partial [Waterburya sp.]